MKKHYVKSWSHFFQEIKAGNKLHDLRKMDREYNIGDILVLQEYDNINGNYTGDQIETEVTYITSEKVPCAFSSSVLEKGYAILSLRLLNLVNIPNCDDVDEPPILVLSEPVRFRSSSNPNAEFYQNGGFGDNH